MDLRSQIYRAGTWIAKSLPVILFCAACIIAIFLYGMAASRYGLFPFQIVSNALHTAESLRDRVTRDPLSRFSPTDIPADDVAKHWISPVTDVDDGAAFLITGGPRKFLQFCPEYGCAAVILDRKGSLIHAYPFRPYEFFEKRIVELKIEASLFDPANDIEFFGLSILPNGDLITVLDFQGAFPYAGGIARLDHDGHVVWYRQDYSHHWPSITDDGDILVTAFNLEHRTLPFSLDGRREPTRSFPCESEGLLDDVIRVLDQNGAVKDEIPVFDALIKGSYGARFALRGSDAGCDPVHTNSVVPVGPALAAKLQNVSAADLLISSRSLDALFIIGRNDHQIKHVIDGTFRRQHSAKPLPDGRIILFDNMGSLDKLGPTRVMVLDPTTNQEITLFPNASTATTLDTLTEIQGRIELSRNGENIAVAAFGTKATSYEIRLADGKILSTFDNVHDLRTFLPGDNRVSTAMRSGQTGIYYVNPDVLSRFVMP